MENKELEQAKRDRMALVEMYFAGFMDACSRFKLKTKGLDLRSEAKYSFADRFEAVFKEEAKDE